MEKQYIELTKRTPLIILEEGKMVIFGRSIVDNPSSFFSPVSEWITDYVSKSNIGINIELGFEYINSGSIKWIYILLKKIPKKLINNIIWYYEEDDEEMRDLGLIFKSLMKKNVFVFRGVKVMKEITEKINREIEENTKY